MENDNGRQDSGVRCIRQYRQGDRVHARRKGRDRAGGVKVDIADLASVEAALGGVDRMFVLAPTGTLDVVGLIAPVIDLAARHRIKLVLMTALGVDADDNIPYRQLELKLEKAGIPFAVIRPNWFADNFQTFWRDGLRHGVISVPAGDGKTSFVDTRDIGESAAALLANSDFDGKAYNLTGPQAFSYAEAAALLAEITGKPLRYEPATDESFIAMLTGAGVHPDYASFLAAIFHLARHLCQGQQGASGGLNHEWRPGACVGPCILPTWTIHIVHYQRSVTCRFRSPRPRRN